MDGKTRLRSATDPKRDQPGKVIDGVQRGLRILAELMAERYIREVKGQSLVEAEEIQETVATRLPEQNHLDEILGKAPSRGRKNRQNVRKRNSDED